LAFYNKLDIFHTFLIVEVSKADSFPVKINCIEQNPCDCIRSNSFNLETAFNIIDTLNINDDILLACLYHQIGVVLYKERAHMKAIKYNKLAEKLRLKNKDGLLWKSRRNIAVAYYDLSILKQRKKKC